MNLDELLIAYWDAAYAEGKEGRDHDTEDGVAQRTLSAIYEEVAAMVKAEREACAAYCGFLASLMERGAGELEPGRRLRQAQETILQGDHYLSMPSNTR